MRHNFSVGQRIMCVDDRFRNTKTMQHFTQWVKRDKTYTVREIRPAGAEGGILLEEIKNPPCYFPHFGGNLEPAFHPKRFVPLEEAEGEQAKEKAKEILHEQELVDER